MAVTVRTRVVPSARVLGWGAGSLGTTTTPRYLFPWYSDQIAEVGEGGLVVPENGVLRDFGVLHGIPEGNGEQIEYTVMVVGVATLLSVSLASTDTYGVNGAVSVPVSAGDRISVLVTKALPIGKSPRNISSVVVLKES